MKLLDDLVRIADNFDRSGHTTLADDLDILIENLSTSDVQSDNLVRSISIVAQILDLKKHPDLADKLDQLMNKIIFIHPSLIVNDLQKIEDKLSEFKDKLCVSALEVKADIRKNNHNPCPFGLSIPSACAKAGESTLYMDAKGSKSVNIEIFNTYKEDKPCIFANNILKNNACVNCSWGTTTEGKSAPKFYRSSPIYPKLWEGFSTINLDRSYHVYTDSNWYSIYG